MNCHKCKSKMVIWQGDVRVCGECLHKWSVKKVGDNWVVDQDLGHFTKGRIE